MGKLFLRRVIGGANILGFHLITQLANNGYPVAAVDRISFLDNKKDQMRRRRHAYLNRTTQVDIINEEYCAPVELTFAEQVEIETGCLFQVLNAIRNYPTIQLLVVSTAGLGMTSEEDAIHSSMANLAETISWEYHKEHNMKVSTVRINGGMFGPWEHPDMPLTAWTNGVIENTETITEVRGKGLLFVHDVARDIIQIILRSRAWDRWSISQEYPYNTIWPEVIDSLDPENTDYRKKIPYYIPHSNDNMMMTEPRRQLNTKRTPLKVAVGVYTDWWRYDKEGEYNEETQVTFDSLYAVEIKMASHDKLDGQANSRDRWLEWAAGSNISLPYTNGPHSYKFFPNKYSIEPMRLLLGILTHNVTLESLTNLCNKHPKCAGFNSDGHVLVGVLPFNKWDEFPSSPKVNFTEDNGLYIAENINFCLHREMHHCQPYSHCVYKETGIYSCVCDEGYIKKSPESCVSITATEPEPSEEEKIKENPVALKEMAHVVICTDEDHATGLDVLITSILKNTANPELIRIHIITNASKKKEIEVRLKCHGIDAVSSNSTDEVHQVNIYTFDTKIVEGMYKVHTNKEITGNLGSPFNYARFYLPTLLRGIRRVIYLDVDTVVRGDLLLLAEEANKGFIEHRSHVFQVAPRDSRQMKKKVHDLFVYRHGNDFYEDTMIQFNAGVMVIDLNRWQQHLLTSEAEFWMKETLKEKLWDFGTQP
eukprot:Ihof_evm10s66 gene=Ihof_evmTU10s66